MRLAICLLIVLQIIGRIAAQNISITTDGSAPHASAMLDIQSTTKGLLIPRMTMAQRNAISTPAAGLIIYQTDNGPGMYLYNGSAWYNVTTAGAGWSLSGNSGTNPATHFIGTSDNQPIRFRLNNLWAGELNGSSGNICLGDSSGFSTTSGTLNTSLGSKSLRVNATGLGNTAIGSFALNHMYVSNTTAVGSYALYHNTYGVTNAALGYSALRTNTIGSYNTAIGYESLRQNQIGDDNTSVGYQALYWNTASFNTAIGTSAMAFNSTGANNTAAGMNAMYSNTTGHENTAVGRDAMLTNQIGSENTSVGFQSLVNCTGHYNTALGAYALAYSEEANSNTAVGRKALYLNTNGWFNTAVGYFTLYSNASGGDNVAFGTSALFGNTTGHGNVGVGRDAGNSNQTGSYNIAIGYGSGTSASFNNTIGIGNDGSLIANHNRVHIGDVSVAWIGGQTGWSTYSDSRIKTNIRDNVPGLDFINRLRPVTYNKDIDLQLQLTGNPPRTQSEHSHDVEQIAFSGFLAQEVEAAAQSCGYDFSGITAPRDEHQLYTLSYESFVVPLVKAVQEQQLLIEALMAEMKTLKEEMVVLKSQQSTVSSQPSTVNRQ